jgi:uncharacterized protein (TIGR02597 family)
MLLATAAGAAAQTAPVGYIEYSFAASGSAATYYISAPMLASPAYTGTLTSAGANTLTVALANWSAGQFTQASAGAPYYAILTSGKEAGRSLLITSNTTTQLTVDVTDDSTQSTPLDTSGFAVSGTESFEIAAGATISSFFGAAAGTAFPGSGASFAASGGIGLWNPQLLAFDQYYYDTTAGEWVKNGASPAANAGSTVIPPSATVAIYLPAGYAGGTLVNAGAPATVAPLLKLPGGSAVRYFGMGVPVDMTLSQVNLGSNWATGSSAFNADTLSVYNSSAGKWSTYYETTGSTWMLSGTTGSQNATVIPAGSAVAFLKRAAVSGSSSLLPVSLPYTP